MALNEVQKAERSEYLERNLVLTECSQKKPYAFVSYASDNWETVFKNAVVPLQKEYGLCVYADKAFDKVNDKWIVPMLRNIRGADVVIAFVSQSYIESYACFLELLTAVNNKKQVVFVALDQELHLGDTTDQPDVERGVKNEILNQGANIATNTNNTSNDLMRAMKSAYTSISTLLEQDALSRYDISDAFINFFRDASINRKTINDLKAVKRTIGSISSEVFDKSLISKQEQASTDAVQPVAPVSLPEETQAVSEPVVQEQQPVTEEKTDNPVTQSITPAFQFDEPKKTVDRKKPLALLIAGGVCALVMIGIIIAVNLPKNVENKVYTTQAGTSGIYTGGWKHNGPDGEGTMTYADGAIYEGEWKNGKPNGWGTYTPKAGNIYEGEWKDGARDGQGTMTWTDGDVYEGEFKDGYRNGQGTYTYADGAVYEGEWKDGKRNGQGTLTYADGTVKTGTWKDSKFVE